MLYRCALLEIPVDAYTLYKADDEDFELWLAVVCDRISEFNRQQSDKAKRGG